MHAFVNSVSRCLSAIILQGLEINFAKQLVSNFLYVIIERNTLGVYILLLVIHSSPLHINVLSKSYVDKYTVQTQYRHSWGL